VPPADAFTHFASSGGVSAANLRLGVTRNRSRLHRDDLQWRPSKRCGYSAWPARSANFQTERAPLLRFLALSALAGWFALSGFAISRTIPLWRWNWVRPNAWSNASLLRFSASRRDRFSPGCDDREKLCSQRRCFNYSRSRAFSKRASVIGPASASGGGFHRAGFACQAGLNLSRHCPQSRSCATILCVAAFHDQRIGHTQPGRPRQASGGALRVPWSLAGLLPLTGDFAFP